MDIVVCIKQVPDTETKIKVAGNTIDKDGVNYAVNPYDEYAIEEALKIKEALGAGSVTLVTVGPSKAQEALRTGLAMGADSAIHVNDESFDGSDDLAIARMLAAAIKTVPHDVVFCGNYAIDTGSFIVGPALAEFLNIPNVSAVIKLDLDAANKKAVAQRVIEGANEVVEVSLPALFSTTKGLNTPRYPSLSGIMKAKKKEIKVLGLSDLGLDSSQVGVNGSYSQVVELSLPAARQAGRIVSNDNGGVDALVRYLKEEVKAL